MLEVGGITTSSEPTGIVLASWSSKFCPRAQSYALPPVKGMKIFVAVKKVSVVAGSVAVVSQFGS